MNPIKILLGSYILASSVGIMYPIQVKEIENDFINSSKVFSTELKILPGDNLSSVNFKDIFGANPTEETPITQVTEVNNDFKFVVMPLKNEMVALMKIGDRAVLFSGGKKENVSKITEFLGKNGVEYLEAIIVMSSDMQEMKSETGEIYFDNNVSDFVEMGLTKKVIIPMPNLDKKTENFEKMNTLFKFRNKLKEKGATVINMADNTKITFMTSEITGYIEKESTEMSFEIKNSEQKYFISNNISEEKLKNIAPTEIDTYILGNNEELTEEFLNKTKVNNVAIINKAKAIEELKLDKLKEELKKKIKEENIIEVSENVYIEINKKTKEIESKTEKKTINQ